MFEVAFKELETVFSPLLAKAGTSKYAEQLLHSEVLGSMKRSMYSGQMSPSEALSNIHLLKSDPTGFAKSTVALPILKSSFESAYQELKTLFSSTVPKAGSKEYIEQLLLRDVL
jgi:hypothetical protein